MILAVFGFGWPIERVRPREIEVVTNLFIRILNLLQQLKQQALLITLPVMLNASSQLSHEDMVQLCTGILWNSSEIYMLSGVLRALLPFSF